MPANHLADFTLHLWRRNRGATRNMPPPGLSPNAVLVSAFWQLLRLLRPALEGRPVVEGASLAAFPAGAMFLQVQLNSAPLYVPALTRGLFHT